MALLKAAQIPERNPGLTIGGVRFDLFNRDRNGLAESGALVFRGRRILIDEDRYLNWLRTQGQQRNAA